MAGPFRACARKGVGSLVSGLYGGKGGGLPSKASGGMLGSDAGKSHSPGAPAVRPGELGKLSGTKRTEEGRRTQWHRDPGSCPRQPLRCPQGHAFSGLAFLTRGLPDSQGPLHSSGSSAPEGRWGSGEGGRETAASRETLVQRRHSQTPNSRESRRL